MKLTSNDLVLKGNWNLAQGKMVADEVCKRIAWLIQYELKKLAVSPEYGEWEVLFQDPSDLRYWELTYPHGEMQGGGPQQLAVISKEHAKKKYDLA
jgi:hypothetical protein